MVVDAVTHEQTLVRMEEGQRLGSLPRDRCPHLALSCSVLSLLVVSLVGTYLVVYHTPATNQEERQISSHKFIGEAINKPRAHLTVKKVESNSNDVKEDDFPTLDWEHQNGLAFTKGDLIYENKTLLIPQKGDYFVYSQVSFRELENYSDDNLIHIITKLTPSYPKPMELLRSIQVISKKSVYRWSVPLYLGAMFELEQGDRLMVNVNNLALVDQTNEHNTFFGAFLL